MNRWRKDRRQKPAQPAAKSSRSEQSARSQLSVLVVLRPVAALAAALRFLTILPLPGRFGTAEKDLAHAAPFFPLVGLLLGCAAAPVAKLLFFLLPPLPAAALTILLLLAFSGGLHLDGLADTADGFFSARTRERMLEIMKDSSIGAMGAAALILILLLKTAALASLHDQRQLMAAVLLMPLAGRTAILLLMALLPYPREHGLGRLFALYFHSSAGKAAAAAGLLLCAGTAYAVAGTRGLTAVSAVLLLTSLFARLCRRKIGGAAGDALGAACELAETALVLLFTVKTGLPL
jgi:adenosylcobinamide-GDP ribazoletransferase